MNNQYLRLLIHFPILNKDVECLFTSESSLKDNLNQLILLLVEQKEELYDMSHIIVVNDAYQNILDQNVCLKALGLNDGDDLVVI